jgi:hypothetical protein
MLSKFKNLMRVWRNFIAVNVNAPVKLWLDDVRPAPAGWYWALDAEEAHDVLQSCVVEEWSLDHDLGEGPSGYDLVQRLVADQEMLGLRFWPDHRPTIHGSNSVERFNMMQLIDRYAPYEKWNVSL